MTLEEANKIADYLEGVGEGCSYCVAEACRQFNEMFPDFEWEMDETAKAMVDKCTVVLRVVAMYKVLKGLNERT